MSLYPISVSEIDFISKGVEEGFRADGRDNLLYREFSLVTGVVSQTYGSARCRLGNVGKGTDIIVGIKAEIGNWIPGEIETENKGKIVCNVDISPIASQFFSGRSAEDLSIELSQLLTRTLCGPQCGIDMESLCIIPKQAYWIIYVDALVLGYDGGIIDPLFYATRAAFSDTKLPKVVVESIMDEGTNIEHQTFEIVDDAEATSEIKGWNNIPLAVTMYAIGKRYVVDCSIEEETVSTARVTVSINSSGDICMIQKGSSRTGFAPSLLNEIFATAKRTGINLIASQDEQLTDLLNKKSDNDLPETSSTFLNMF
ncbi:hypothetical protein BB559_006199 [Furculomyces boomerangus]|uniref:Ribosomal RNA-processing protein 42 n=2 Tax=Harpellales TaxID=61421 RepID=A0A2T9Y4B7_9FUNG|nr:hypothetical protein BB559_006199 [Furculomyces boomerangus]PVZ97189.1 hypothetical protein BB558_006861 [Smittium angustum]PWA02222.1 hypothetical protein BB558_001649 [Smittium angustum]